MALCAFIDGVPMTYQGDEDPAIYMAEERDSIDYLSRIYGIRNTTLALRRGTADYTVAATNGIFVCLRETSDQRALVLISFNPDRIISTLTLPGAIAGTWIDLMSGEDIDVRNETKVGMSPHQVRVFVDKHQS